MQTCPEYADCGHQYFGTRTSAGSSDEFSFFRTDAGLFRSDFGGNRVTFSSETDLTQPTIVIKDGSSTTIGGETITNTSATFTSAYPLYLFACDNAGTPANHSNFKMYYCKIWNNGEIVRNYVPVLDNNGVACLYDKVSEQLFYGQGTGYFGANETSIYKAVNYIESTGTQYIDTGIRPTTTTKLQMIIENKNTTTSTHFEGSRVGFQNNALGVSYQTESGNVGTTFAYANQVYYSKTTQTGRAFYEVLRNIVINQNLVYTFSIQTITNNHNIYFFTVNNAGTPHTQKASLKLYYACYLDSDVAIRHFMPVLRKSDNEPCLYDLVSGEFYTNAGTGTFLYG